MHDEEEDEAEQVPTHESGGMTVCACPCGSRSIAYQPMRFVFCSLCLRRGPESTDKATALHMWNRYTRLAYWRERNVRLRTKARE